MLLTGTTPTSGHLSRGGRERLLLREQRPRRFQRCRGLERRPQLLATAEPLEVPGIELTQIAHRALGSQMGDGLLHDPVELDKDLFASRWPFAPPQQLL